MVKAVVWDIGNVFAYWEPEAHYDRLIGAERRARFFEETSIHQMNEDIDLGGHSREVAYAHAETHPKWRDEIRRWHDDWSEMFRRPVPGMAGLFKDVKATGIPCIALSNFGDNTLETAKQAHPALAEFDQEFVSARLRLVKPDPAIYAAVEDGTGHSGEALLFTDDRPENIEAAAARDWKVHLFEDAHGWRDRLETEGVIEKAK